MKYAAVSLTLVAVGLWSPNVTAQKVHLSSVSGTLVSRSVTTVSGESVALYEVPQDARFILTQACRSRNLVDLRGDSLGQIVIAGVEIGPLPSGCTTYVPGVLFESEDVITCEAPPSSVGTERTETCLISGVLQKKPRHGRRHGRD